jgi:hypothetical protein
VSEPAAGLSPLGRLLAGGQRALKLIEFPGPRGVGPDGARIPVGVWALLDVETRTARIAAITYLTDTLKLTEAHLIQLPELGDEEVKVQLLALALRDPAAPARPFATPADLRLLTPDEREAFFAAYLEWVAERSPLRQLAGAEEVEALIEALKKDSTSAITLSSYDGASLRSVVRSMAARLSRSTTPPSWASTPASGSPTSPTPTSPGSPESAGR